MQVEDPLHPTRKESRIIANLDVKRPEASSNRFSDRYRSTKNALLQRVEPSSLATFVSQPGESAERLRFSAAGDEQR
jgi:hypothetical protein